MKKLYEEFPELEVVERDGRHRLRARRSVLRLAPGDGVGAEIGVFTGLFAEVLVDITTPSKLYLVDPWEKLHGHSFPNWGSYTANQALSTHAAKSAAKFRAGTLDTDCVVVEAFCDQWLSTFSEPFLDWVYLDASHKYESVLGNLRHIGKRVYPDGVIMGDDCWVTPDYGCSDTFYAIQDFIADSDYKVIHLDEYGQWAISCSVNLKSRRAQSDG